MNHTHSLFEILCDFEELDVLSIQFVFSTGYQLVPHCVRPDL